MAGLRTRARGHALQVLYALDLNEGEASNAAASFQRQFEVELEPDGVAFADTLVQSAQSNAEAIDDNLQTASKNWRLERMSTVDRNILRLGTAELLYHATVPTKVVINEAIELAKRFGTTESPAFVNGILDRVAAKVRG